MSRKNSRELSRREAIKGMAAASAAAALGGCVTGKTPRADVIVRENLKPGTRDWMLTKTGVDPKTKYRCPWIEGYCSKTSVAAGETIDVFVSTNPASVFRVELFRMGYYGGAGGRKVAEFGPFRGSVQPEPPIGKKRVRECRWYVTTSIKIPDDWVSGVYVGKLTAETGGWQSYVIFILRDSRRADLMFQCSDNTWQAYNRWPSQFALYDDGHNQWYWGPSADVSFDRPYGKYCQIVDAPLSTGSGEFFLWEFPFVYWMESLGYDVSYVSNMDTHARRDELLRAKGFISIGHDEYYSLEMYHNFQWAISRGLNVGFFSGNTCCGRIDPRPSSSGVPNRVFSRIDFFGPRTEADVKRLPTMGLLPHVSPNAAHLVGARTVAPITGGADWICSKPEHWMFDGTEMKKGDSIPGLVGWEWHGEPASLPGLEIVSSGKTQSAPGNLNGGVYTSTIYPGPKNNLVFNASTCWWADGLSEPPGYVRPSVYTTPKGVDRRVQRITANILNRFVA
jgi:hypothetical protein